MKHPRTLVLTFLGCILLTNLVYSSPGRPRLKRNPKKPTTKQKDKKAWLWVAVASTFAVFGIFMNRKRESLQKLVGDYSGIILNCDRAKMYFDGKRLQWCWAHLKRDIQKLIDSNNNQVKRLGHDLMRQQKLLFQHWRRYKAGEIKWSTFQKTVRPIRKKFNALLLRGLVGRLKTR